MIQQLSAAVRDGYAIVTANQRLARDYRALYDEQQRDGGARVWTQLSVMPWTSWVRKLWTEAVLAGRLPAAVLLNRPQAEAVWRRIIEDSPQSDRLLQTRATALSAMSAWSLIQQHRIPWKRINYESHEDWTAFTGWAHAFERICARNGWIDEPRLPTLVAEALHTPERILPAGFDEFTPQQKALLDGTTSLDAETRGPGSAVRCAWLDGDAELRAAARWARWQWEREPAGRIGVVIPNLDAVRGAVQRVFEQVFDAESQAFHISLGRPLTAYPLVHAAFSILRMTSGKLALGEADALLRSPFIAGADVEASGRAHLDAKIRRHRLIELSVPALRRAAGGCPRFAEALDRWDGVRRGAPQSQGASAWARTFAGLLAAAGWPGDRQPGSAEYQTLRAWNDLLLQFCSLDLVSGPLTRDAAIERLRELAQATEFQPEDPRAPVQITGALEAAGAAFDRLWIAGLTDDAWPAPARPHPFLPPSLQIEYTLPHCSAEREYEFALRTTERLLASAPEVVVSYATRDGERELRPSPLIRELPEHLLELPEDAWWARITRRAVLEEIVDSTAPPFLAAEARGGTKVLQHQAQCPFHAFAEIRLGARTLESGALGVAPAERGIALHKALELFWREVKSQQRLLAMSGAELSSTARAVAMEAVAEAAPQIEGSGLDRRFRELECERVASVLLDWLEFEKTRTAFEVVQEEKERTIHIGGLDVKTRIDRVDRLPDGQHVIIDYKTTAPSLNAWDGPRMDQPQVPLYACSMAEPVGAVAFAQLTPGDLKFRGYGAANALPKVKASRDGDTMPQRIAAWRQSLESLAEEFRQGHAVVDPQKGACEFCGLTALCRVVEAGNTEEENGIAG